MAELNVPDRTFFEGDNLAILQGINSECVDLIATDPPFNKRRNMAGRGGKYPDQWYWADTHAHTHNCPPDCDLRAVPREWLDEIKARGEIAAQQKGAAGRRDAARYNGLVATIEAARLTHDDGIAAFLCFLAVRLLECHRILKPTGSIYLHCDHSANAYIRLAMDAIFGKDNFRNEIVWCYTGPGSPQMRQFNRKHDTIYWYAKGSEWTFNRDAVRIPYKDGRPHTGGFTHQSGAKAGTNMDQSVADQYQQGKIAEDWWPGIAIAARGSQNTGWPTQKPLALMQRIIAASSNPGDVILDPFAGCATTLVACENMGQGQRRRWIGIDRAAMAKVHVLNRLLDTDSRNAAVAVRKVPGSEDDGVYDEAEFQKALAANRWAMRLETMPPQRTDAGERAPGFATPHRPTTKPKTTFSYAEMLARYFARWLYRCAGCGKPAPSYPNGKVDTGDFQLDHLTPRDLNDPGTDELDNRCALCAKCNRKKSDALTLTGLQRQNAKDGELYLKRADLPKENDIRAWGRREVATAKTKGV